MSKPKQLSILPPHYRYHSYFRVTHRNLLLYWIANIVIFPIFIFCIFTLTENIPLPDGLDFLQVPLRDGLRICAFIPILLTFFTPNYWHMGFRSREWSIIAAAISVFFLTSHSESGSLPQIEFNNHPFELLRDFVIVWGGINLLRVVIIWRWRLPAFALLGSLALIYVIVESEHYFKGIQFFRGDQNYELLFFSLWLIIPLAYCFYRLFDVKHEWDLKPRWQVRYVRFWLSILCLLCVIVNWLANGPLYLRSAACLALLFLSAGPELVLNRQLAHLRNVLQPIRHDMLQEQASPLAKSLLILNRLRFHWFPRYVTFDNHWFFLIATLLIGGIGIPAYAAITSPDYQSPLDLMWLGVVSSLVLISVYLIIWAIRNRNAYLISHFVTEKGQDSSQLNIIADHITHSLVKELQNISLLLRQRQVENVNLVSEDTNAFFVTSGFNQEFITQMEQVATIEVPPVGTTINLGRLFTTLMLRLARIHISGWIQLEANDVVSVSAELNFRNRRTTVVTARIEPRYSLEEIDEKAVRSVARELALKLFIELGQVSHLGESWHSLADFLTGLEASAKRNWWQAISYYRKALQAVETSRGSFGIGHYHLGAALIYQSSFWEGQEHLRTAESDGPLMGETQYMLALVLLYQYWGELHEHPNIFHEIDRHCCQAFRFRPNFPEVHQLRGTAYYRRAKLIDRQNSPNHYDTADTQQVRVLSHPKNMRADYPQYYYKEAAKHFHRALKAYDRILKDNQRNGKGAYQLEPNADYLMQQRMTAAHQLGDALRSLSHFSLAETYYRDVMLVYPRNLRNLTDLSKCYCLARNWQQAEEFFWRTVFSHDFAYWDADVALHMGWAIAGGVFNSGKPWLKKYFDRAVNWYYHYEIEDDAVNTHLQLGKAFEFLDFALHQRPRYITYWRQTNWFERFDRTVTQLSKHGQDSDSTPDALVNRYHKKLPTDRPDVYLFRVWLALRMDAYGHLPSSQNWQQYIDSFFKSLEYSPYRANYLSILHKYSLLRLNKKEGFRYEASMLIQLSEQQKRVGGVRNQLRRLELAEKLWKNWRVTYEDCKNVVELQKQNCEAPSFAERWAVDVFAELASLTSQMLANAEAYELLYDVAQVSSEFLSNWIERWRKNYPIDSLKARRSVISGSTNEGENPHYTFSPRVIRYQQATLQSWKAFALYQKNFDSLTCMRIDARKNLNQEASGQPKDVAQNPIETIDQIQRELDDEAREYITYHPLAMYIRAKLYRRRGLYARAIEEYERLIDLIAPYDPKRDIGGLEEPNLNPTSDSDRGELYYQEKVSGRQQFSNFVNETRIHLEIAETFSEMKQSDKLPLVIDHLLQAARLSPHSDLDIDAFLLLAEQLNNQERYDEAHAILDAVRDTFIHLQYLDLSESTRRAPDILSCVVNTRRGLHAQSLDHGKEIARRVKVRLPTDYLELIDDKLNQPSTEDSAGLKKLRDFFSAVKKSVDSKNIVVDFSKTKEFLELEGLVNLKSLDTGDFHAFIRHSIEAYHDSLKKAKTQQFPRVFWQLENNPLLINSALQIAYIALSRQAMIDQLTHLFKDAQNFNGLEPEFAHVILSQITRFLAEEASNGLIQIAELANSLAYNRAETGLHLFHAVTDSITAVCILYTLASLSEHETPVKQKLTRKLAQFCDTVGWVHYRLALSERTTEILGGGSSEGVQSKQLASLANKRFKRALSFLRKGIRYDQQRAIIHLHLAELYLTKADMVLAEDSSSADNIPSWAQINAYLSEGLLHWRQAKDHDQFGRLHTRLIGVNRRLVAEKGRWEKRAYDPEKSAIQD